MIRGRPAGASRHSSRRDDGLYTEALARMNGRIRQTLLSGVEGFPHYADPLTGVWTTTPDGFWTGGFWSGELWLASLADDEHRFEDAATDWLRRLRSRVESKSVFRGFLFYYAAVVGAVVRQNAEAEKMAIDAARSLAATFDERAGLMPLGVEAEEAHTVGDDESNIDGLIASPLLLWAARKTDDADMARKALSHARRNAELCVNSNGSVVQSASFDRATGALTRRYTHKGYAETSIWTRAQAWAMLGYALCARQAPEERWLQELAVRTADWWVAHVPDDLVAYWDFDAPRTPQTCRDTSGTAIAAAALLKIAANDSESLQARAYGDVAERTVRSLISRHLTPVSPDDKRPAGILADGCFDPKNGVAMRSELIWGDYFLLEALNVLAGRIASDAI
jgi:unsaturated chondroitin disaccharide hydrolase